MSNHPDLFLSAADAPDQVTTIKCLNEEGFASFVSKLTPAQQSWVENNDFTAKAGQLCLLPDASGALECALFGFSFDESARKIGCLANKLPEGCYQFAEGASISKEVWHNLFFILAEASYRYTCTDKELGSKQKWVVPECVDLPRLQHEVTACRLGRDLINTPANSMQSTDLAAAAEALANKHGASFSCITGDALLEAGFEATHVVGAVGEKPPCMIDFSWGNPSHPSITLVGKGVCFDSGGLCLKTARGMETMKKDMGGAAHVLAMAQLIMSQQLPVSLRVLIPALENGTGKGAYRMADIIRYRDGTCVEVMNTDAEGRLVLADAILEAVSEGNPDLLIDFSTLTGAARIAVGMDMGAYFSNEEAFIPELMQLSQSLEDPLWPLPLYRPYKKKLDSDVADMTNAAASGYGGATIAALFLEHFVPNDCPWLHLDVSGWSSSSYYGQQKGGAMLGIRSVYRFLENFISNK